MTSVLDSGQHRPFGGHVGTNGWIPWKISGEDIDRPTDRLTR